MRNEEVHILVKVKAPSQLTILVHVPYAIGCAVSYCLEMFISNEFIKSCEDLVAISLGK